MSICVKLCIFMSFGIKLPRLYIHDQDLKLTFVTSAKCKVTWEKVISQVFQKLQLYYTDMLLMVHCSWIRWHETLHFLSHFWALQGKLICVCTLWIFSCKGKLFTRVNIPKFQSHFWLVSCVIFYTSLDFC